MHTLLLTGGAGFIGSHLTRMLLALDAHVIVLDKLTYAGSLESLGDHAQAKNLRFVQGDICDGPLVRRLFADERPATVFHLAAESHVDRSIEGPASFVETNVNGSCTLLEQALAYWRELPDAEKSRFRFVQISTDEVYGSLGSAGKFTEHSPFAPNSPYAASKAAADLFVRAYHRTFGLPAIITHCSNNYGPYQFPEKLIPLMILNAAEGRELPVYGQGDNVRDWIHVEDHCRALLTVAEQGIPGETYNIGGNCERTNLQIVQSICDLIDERLQLSVSAHTLIRFVADRPGHDLRYAVDSTKLEHTLNWQAHYSFDAGLTETVDWYLSHLRWVEQRRAAGIHRTRRGLVHAGDSQQ